MLDLVGYYDKPQGRFVEFTLSFIICSNINSNKLDRLSADSRKKRNSIMGCCGAQTNVEHLLLLLIRPIYFSLFTFICQISLWHLVFVTLIPLLKIEIIVFLLISVKLILLTILNGIVLN